MNARLIQTREQMLRYWQARNPREQVILTCGGAVLLLAIYIGSLQAINTRIEALRKRLPELTLNSYEIAAGTRENRPPVPRAREDLRSELFRLLAEQDIKAELRGLAPDRVEMRLPPGNGETALRQLNALRLASGSRVASLQLRATDAANAEFTAILERRR
jgi:type II secretory pathway component PulM